MKRMGNLTSLPFACLVCEVDSGPIRTMLLLFTGTLVLSSISFLTWAWATNRFSKGESGADLALKAEGLQRTNHD